MSTIQIKRSVATATPPSLAKGEVAWSDASLKLFIGLANDNTVTPIGGSGFVTGFRLDQFAVPTANVSLNSHKITSLLDPTSSQDAATKNYVDNRVNGLSWKQRVRAATAAALPAYTQSGAGATGTLTANSNGVLTVDGVVLDLNEDLLVKDGAAGSDNGFYTLTQLGDGSHPFILTRRSDFTDSTNADPDSAVFVSEGTANADKQFILTTNAPITVDATSLTFVVFAAGVTYTADETTIHLAGNSFSIKTTYVGQASITTLGTIGTGVWQGTAVAVGFGGTGASSAGGARTNLGAAASGANSDITSLSGLTTALSVLQGGTGATTAGAARTSLGAAASGANSDITSLSGLTTALSVGQGGTGATSAGAARTSLGAAASGANSDITSLSGLTTALSVLQGGTGATTSSGARTSLGAAASGANSDITQLSGLTTALSVGQGGTGATSAGAARTSLGAAALGANSDITSLSGLTTPLSVAQGGIGVGTVTGVLKGNGTSAISAATAGTDFMSPANVQNQTASFASETGTANAYVMTPSPAVSSLTVGERWSFIAANANTGASTLTVGSSSTKNIFKFGTNALVAGDIAAGQLVEVVYDGVQYQMISPGVYDGGTF